MFAHALRYLCLGFIFVLAACSAGAHTPFVPASESGGVTLLHPMVAQQNNGATFIPITGLNADLGAYTWVKSAVRNADGNIWVALFWHSSGPENRFEMAKIGDSGAVTRLGTTLGATCGGAGAPLASLSDGSIWYANLLDTDVRNAVCRVLPTGARKEVVIAGLPADTTLSNAAAGPDGNVWFSYETSSGTSAGLVRVTPAGVSTVMPLAGNVKNVVALKNGPGDGNLWLTGYDSANHPYVGKMSTAGSFIGYPAPAQISTIGDIVPAAGDLFVSYLQNMGSGLAPGIARVTTAGSYRAQTDTASMLCTSACQVSPLIAGPLGSLWFMSNQGLERYVIASNTYSAPIATPLSNSPSNFAAAYGSDNNIWTGDLYDSSGNTTFGVYVAHVLTTSPATLTFSATGQTQQVVASETNFTGTYSATTSNAAVATVSATATNGVFVVTSHGPGTATVTVSDSTTAYKANTAPINVNVQ